MMTHDVVNSIKSVTVVESDNINYIEGDVLDIFDVSLKNAFSLRLSLIDGMPLMTENEIFPFLLTTPNNDVKFSCNFY